MIDKSRRKELLDQYADRKPSIGVFALRDAVSGEVWVGSSKSLDKQKNGLWFSLKLGSSPNRDVQAAWTAHGEDAFSYEIVEELTEDDPHVIARVLPERTAHWREVLGAKVVKGI